MDDVFVVVVDKCVGVVVSVAADDLVIVDFVHGDLKFVMGNTIVSIILSSFFANVIVMPLLISAFTELDSRVPEMTFLFLFTSFPAFVLDCDSFALNSFTLLSSASIFSFCVVIMFEASTVRHAVSVIAWTHSSNVSR